ncbi:MAG: DUF4282 domain-containing protein [Gemmataceae bacterium]
MTVVIACPICTQKVRAPDSVLGRQIKCPQCKNPFIALDPNAIPPAPAFDAGFPDKTGTPVLTDEDAEISEDIPRRPSAVTDYLLFRRMVTPVIITVLFYLGVLLLLLGGLVLFVSGVLQAVHGYTLIGIATILGSIVGGIVELILWRIFCEVLITLFRILDNVREINEQMKSK